ncbi:MULTISPECIES: peroxiredoxin family protein [Nocardia]|uniref:peroxiredoxin family protein n=1 Tax=Nocardia TaxID=1817 RepID=UPI001951EC77|nr:MULTISPECIES: peroxiredoxin family protein [Nocardia]
MTGPRGSHPPAATVAAVALVVVVVVAVLYVVFRTGSPATDPGAGASGYPHVAGDPGTGEMAPDFTLASGAGTPVSLTAYRGRSVLLYFQEGLTCQPCWDQIRDLERNTDALTSAGVDAVVSITTDPAALIGRKAADEHLTTVVASDPDLKVSRAYDANSYGMMGQMRDGHSFVLVGPDGVIAWRADYDGAPQHTMYLPTAKLLADLRTERRP